MAQKQRPPPWRGHGDDLKIRAATQQLVNKNNVSRRRAQGTARPQRIQATSAPRRHSPSKDGRPSGTPYAPARLIRRPVDATRLKGAMRAQIYGSLLRLDARAEKMRGALMAADDRAAAAFARDILASAGTIARALQKLRAIP